MLQAIKGGVRLAGVAGSPLATLRQCQSPVSKLLPHTAWLPNIPPPVTMTFACHQDIMSVLLSAVPGHASLGGLQTLRTAKFVSPLVM